MLIMASPDDQADSVANFLDRVSFSYDFLFKDLVIIFILTLSLFVFSMTLVFPMPNVAKGFYYRYKLDNYAMLPGGRYIMGNNFNYLQKSRFQVTLAYPAFCCVRWRDRR